MPKLISASPQQVLYVATWKLAHTQSGHAFVILSKCHRCFLCLIFGLFSLKFKEMEKEEKGRHYFSQIQPSQQQILKVKQHSIDLYMLRHTMLCFCLCLHLPGSVLFFNFGNKCSIWSNRPYQNNMTNMMTEMKLKHFKLVATT